MMETTSMSIPSILAIFVLFAAQVFFATANPIDTDAPPATLVTSTTNDDTIQARDISSLLQQLATQHTPTPPGYEDPTSRMSSLLQHLATQHTPTPPGYVDPNSWMSSFMQQLATQHTPTPSLNHPTGSSSSSLDHVFTSVPDPESTSKPTGTDSPTVVLTISTTTDAPMNVRDMIDKTPKATSPDVAWSRISQVIQGEQSKIDDGFKGSPSSQSTPDASSVQNDPHLLGGAVFEPTPGMSYRDSLIAWAHNKSLHDEPTAFYPSANAVYPMLQHTAYQCNTTYPDTFSLCFGGSNPDHGFNPEACRQDIDVRSPWPDLITQDWIGRSPSS